MTVLVGADTPVTEAVIAARIERLPLSSWQRRVRIMVGTATFFDGFDSLSIAMVLPVLAGLWHLSPPQIGTLLSISYAGQAIGAIAGGWIAERIGRVTTLRIAIGIFGLLSLACALVGNYEELLACRFLGGLGIGAEVPIAATYISEIARARGRGAFVLLYELVFSIGLMAASLLGAWIVPRFGWQALFVVGAVPAMFVVFMQRFCPESPRWLATRGRLGDADRVMTQIEAEVVRSIGKPLPPPAELPPEPPRVKLDWRELFRGLYLRRTIVVWLLWATAYFILTSQTYWLPTLYRTVFHLPLQQSLNLAFLNSVASVVANLICALTIDWTGRRKWFIGVYVSCTVLGLLLLVLGADSLRNVILLAWTSLALMTTISLSLYVYTPEIYPTRMRSLGVSVATFWPRLTSFGGPIIVGWILPHWGAAGLFAVCTAVAAIGAVTCFAGVAEGRGRVLEEFSP